MSIFKLPEGISVMEESKHFVLLHVDHPSLAIGVADDLFEAGIIPLQAELGLPVRSIFAIKAASLAKHYFEDKE